VSPEALALISLANEAAPSTVRAGDLYAITKDHRYVMLVLGHKKNGRRLSDGHTFVFMYHWDEPSLRAKPADLRDHDGNANCAERWLEWSRSRGESVRYVGNIFDYAPLHRLIEQASSDH
jgi:hypothetical protein